MFQHAQPDAGQTSQTRFAEPAKGGRGPSVRTTAGAAKAKRDPAKDRDPVDVHIGSRLKLRRKSLGLSQSALARQLEVTCQQVCKYERGDNRMTASKLFLASEVLSCPIAFFFEGLSRSQPASKPAGERAERILSHFLSGPDGLQLAGEFAKIRSRRLRRHLTRLISCLAEEERGGG